jgi:hypothetical protein
MKPIIETGYKNYKVVSWKPTGFSANNDSFDSPFMFGYVMAHSPQDAFDKKKKQGNDVYGVQNKQGEYIYPPQLVQTIENMRQADEDIPF